MTSLEVKLACGVWREETPRLDAVVHPLSLDDERQLVDDAASLLPAQLVTRLLERCAEVGAEASAEVMRELTVGDRALLLLAFHRLVFDESLSCLVDCTSCAERLELDLDARSLVAEPAEPRARVVRTAVNGTQVSFRLPTGGDEERAALAALADADAATAELLQACVLDAGALTLDTVAPAVESAIAELDPHAEIALTFTCPACGADSASILDPASYVVDELRARVAGLEREVHALASRYGWTERDILALPAPRRRRYVDLAEAGPGA